MSAVDHPSHYNQHPSGIEAIEVCEHLSFNLGNAFKYLFRRDQKTSSPVQDLEKALWYIRRELTAKAFPRVKAPYEVFEKVFTVYVHETNTCVGTAMLCIGYVSSEESDLSELEGRLYLEKAAIYVERAIEAAKSGTAPRCETVCISDTMRGPDFLEAIR